MAQLKFISNEPCGEDLFAGKAHESTAKQIAELLKKSSISLMIGLEGGWGTGKSNLISLVQKEMSEDSPLFFTYDAWGHQDDLTRRSILEELTYYICNNEQATQALKERKKDEWETKLKNLLSKKREVRTKDIPKISTGILVITLAIILTPIFSSIADAIPASDFWWIKPALSSIPLCFTLGYVIVRYCKMKDKSWKLLLEELISLYKEKTKENTTYEEEFAAEPSSKQFKDWMKELDKDLQKKLIVVFDNMDRLPPRRVQEFWAAIHSFFSEVKYDNIQVIVPFDRNHILAAFHPETIVSQDIDDERGVFYGNDFINKTFDVVYRVAPPTMSNWKGYLSSMWKEAVGEDLTQASSITQIYDLMTESKSPRKIISFINECVTIKTNQSFKVPDEYIALYVVGKYEIQKNPYDELLNLNFCEPLAYKYKNEETSKFLSALYFQLPTEEAIELIYTDKLRRELESGKSDLLLKLKNSTLRNDLLENAIAKVNNHEYATNALTQSGLTIEVKFWDQLLMKIQLEKDGVNLKDHQIELLKHSSKNNALNHLNKMMKYLYNNISIQEDGEENLNRQDHYLVDAVKLYDNITYLSDRLKGFDYLNPFSLLKQTYTSPESYIEFIQIAGQEHVRYLVECSNSKVDDYLSKLPIEKLKTLTAIPYLKYELPEYQKLLQSQITEVDILTEAETLINRWVELGVTLTTLPSDDNIDNWFSECKKDTPFYYYLVSIRIAKGGSYNGNEFDLLSSQADNQTIEKISHHIESFISYGDLLLQYNSMEQYPMYIQIAKHMILHQTGNQKFPLQLDRLLMIYNKLISTFEVELFDLIQDWNRWEDDYTERITTENISKVPTDFFKESALNVGIVSHCHTVAVDYLQSITIDKWREFFVKEEIQYKLLVAINRDIPNAYEAFKNIITEELGDQKLLISDELYDSLVALFEGQGKNWSSVYQNIRDRYSISGKDITEQLFIRHGNNIITQGHLEDNPKSIRTLLPTSLLKNDFTLSIVTNNIERIGNVFKQVKNDYVIEFIDEVKSVLKVNENERLTELLHILGVSSSSEENLA